VGVTIAGALAILAIAILAIGNASRMFSAKAEYRTEFADVLGLREGSPVYLSGVQVGSVTGMELPADPTRRNIEIHFSVDRKISPRIREGTTATLSFLQMLSGDKLIILEPGDPEKPMLPEGSLIPQTQAASLFEAGTSAATNVAEITAKLNGILDPILDMVEHKQGLIGRLVADPSFGQKGLDDLAATLVAIRRLTESLNQGQGLAGRLLADQKLGQTTLDSLQGSLVKLEGILGRIEQGQGALGKLLAPGGEGEELLAELRGTAADLHAVVTDLKTGNGLAHTLIYDEAWAATIRNNLTRSSESLASILEKVDRGEGTAGALVNDPAVYEGLEDIVSGVRGSRIGTGFLRHYQKKGQKLEEKARPADPAAPQSP
jgi:phospholipid/cholesterol/gamma-HCH transport system substrate-binding protein